MNTPTLSTATQPAHQDKRAQWLRIGVPLVLITAIGLGLLAYCQQPSDPRSLRDLIVQSRDAYHEPWATIDDAAIALGSAEAALAFVQNQVGTSFYEGRLQAPQTVLETRVANPADKAILLQALLGALDTQTVAYAAPLQGAERTELLAQAGPAERAWPEPLTALMNRIAYDSENQPVDQLADDLMATFVLEESQNVVGMALDHAAAQFDLTGPSASAPLFLDWVWLEADDGTVYDPVLPQAERSDLARRYDEPLQETQLVVSARDRFGRTRDIVSWSGNSFGTDVGLAFYPTINTQERFIGDPDLSDVTVWTPTLVAGSEIIAHAAVTVDGDVVPPSIVSTLTTDDTDAGLVEGFEAPTLSSLSLANVSADTFPRVEVGLNVAVQTPPNWHAGHFRVLVEGQAVPVRIEEPFSNRTHVVTLHDHTGSMMEAGRDETANTFGQNLVSNLSVDQRLAMISAGERIRVERLFDPITDPNALLDNALWDRPVGGRSPFLDAIDHALNAIEIELGVGTQEPTAIVLISDGEPAQTIDDALRNQLNRQIERAQSLGAAIYPVLLSGSTALDYERMAEETGGSFIRVLDPSRAASAAQALARRLSGGMAISFTAPHDRVPEAGSQIPFTVEVVGYDAILDGLYTVPADIIASQPALFLEISNGRHRAVQTLAGLGEHYSVAAMTGSYTVFTAPGSYPADRMTAQLLDDWLMAHDVAVEDEVAVLDALNKASLSTAHLTTMNGLANLMQTALPDGQRLRFPMAVLSRTQLDTSLEEAITLSEEGEEEIEYQLVTTIDAAPWSSFLTEEATRADVARMGLALNDAEARLLGQGTNLSQSFVEGDAGTREAEEDEHLLASADHDDRFWTYQPSTGALFGYLQSNGAIAKGSQDVVIAQRFADINTAIDIYMLGARPGLALTPAKTVFAGFVGFKKAEMKLWCFSTIMLNYVTEVIEGDPDAILNESAQAAEARAAELCELRHDAADIGREMMEDAIFGLAKGVFTEVRRQGIPGVFGGTNRVVQSINRSLGGDYVTSWISSPVVRQYVERLATGVRRGQRGTVDNAFERPFNELADRLRRYTLGGSQSPVNSGFDEAMGQAIAELR